MYLDDLKCEILGPLFVKKRALCRPKAHYHAELSKIKTSRAGLYFRSIMSVPRIFGKKQADSHDRFYYCNNKCNFFDQGAGCGVPTITKVCPGFKKTDIIQIY